MKFCHGTLGYFLGSFRAITEGCRPEVGELEGDQGLKIIVKSIHWGSLFGPRGCLEVIFEIQGHFCKKSAKKHEN